MESRPLGTSGISASRLGLGCVTFGREVDESLSFKLLDYAFEHGIRLFDTAEAYGGGQARAYRKCRYGVDDEREVSGELHSSEKILGRWLHSRGVRKQVLLVTKVKQNFTTAHVLEALAGSVERLQTDAVDVYLFHSFDRNSPVEESALALHAAAESGLTRTIGCSNYSAAQMQELLNVAEMLNLTPPQVVESPYNLLERGIESDLLPLCRKNGIGVLGYSPLAAGFLTGKYSPDPGALPWGSRFHVIPGHIDDYFNEANFEAVRRLRMLAEDVHIPAERLAVAWTLLRPEITTILVGATAVEHLRNALDAYAMTIGPDLLQHLAETSPAF